MDVLAGSGLEPQLAIPVIFVVVGAVLVYIFGFQKTEEPSYEHLAVLQSSSSYKNRSVNVKQNTNKSSSSSGGGSKSSTAKTNGHVVNADKEKEKSNGVLKNKVQPSTSGKADKENKPPQVKVQAKKDRVKTSTNKPEDFESGDWIQATSRKDKKKKSPTQSDAPGSPIKEQQRRTTVTVTVSPPRDQPQQKSPIVIVEEGEEAIPASVLKEIEAVIQRQSHSTQTSPEKKSSKVVPDKDSPTSSPSTAPSTPVKKPQAEVKPTPVVIVQEKAAPEPVKEQVPPAKEKAEAKPKSNIAFDEMGGDTWEEAKSRGTKKRRTRKD